LAKQTESLLKGSLIHFKTPRVVGANCVPDNNNYELYTGFLNTFISLRVNDLNADDNSCSSDAESSNTTDFPLSPGSVENPGDERINSTKVVGDIALHLEPARKTVSKGSIRRRKRTESGCSLRTDITEDIPLQKLQEIWDMLQVSTFNKLSFMRKYASSATDFLKAIDIWGEAAAGCSIRVQFLDFIDKIKVLGLHFDHPLLFLAFVLFTFSPFHHFSCGV
jgi:hypothetical protein